MKKEYKPEGTCNLKLDNLEQKDLHRNLEANASRMFIVTNTLRPRTWPALIPLLAAGFVIYIDQKEPENLSWVAYAMIAMAVVVWIILLKIQITIDDISLTHQNLFRTRQINWNDVTATYIKYHSHGQSGSYYWFFENVQGQKIRFSISLYGRTALRQLAEAVVNKCGHAEIDTRITNMATGDFPWYIF
ncbi:MAG: hypothetical protein ACO1OO_11425 [Flavisolibacter sp.]